MRITFASYHTVMLKHGGPKTQILQTKKCLEKAGVEVHLMDTWGDKASVFDCDLFHLFASNLGTYDLARYLNAHSKRFVSTPIFFTRRSPTTVRLISLSDRVVRRFANGFWSDYGFARDICDWAERVLPNTRDEKTALTNGLSINPRKITLVPNGVEDRFLHGDPNLFYKQYGMKDFILNVGHIGVERKNTLSLIRALNKIDHPSVIVGRAYPSQEAELCLAEAEKNDNLLLIPGLDHDSPMLASAYAAATVFVLPARYETPGIAALEAGLAGANIVITPHGGTRDYFGDLAIYVNPYSIDSIRKGIENALEKERDTTLQNHIQQNFLWQKVAQKTADVYGEILGLGTPAEMS